MDGFYIIEWKMEKIMNKQLLKFIEESPSCFHAVENLKQLLLKNGYCSLNEQSSWEISKGGKYFVTRNGSSIIAFSVGQDVEKVHYQMTSSHSDSPTFKIKEVATLKGKGGSVRFNTEMYGGLIAASWFDRPLSLAGRILIQTENGIESKLVNIHKDILMIPNLAIHMNRTINSGYTYNMQKDTLPLVSMKDFSESDFNDLLANSIGVKAQQILGKDIYLYNRQVGMTWGINDEFISAPKLDDLQCAYTSFQALCDSANENVVNVSACFDNEEVGSSTKQGAESTFLFDTLQRIQEGFDSSHNSYASSIARSFMVSCDNAHALHPNYTEVADETNYVCMNAGVVVKHSANQKYTTDAISHAVFNAICQKANVPIQHFANRSDMAGGSTLGNISSTKVSVHSIDIGLAQLAMHSSYESAGALDTAYMYEALKAYYNTTLDIQSDSQIVLK